MTAGRVLRGLTGVLAGGLVALLVVLVVAWYLSGTPGPGTATLVWHGLAAAVAVAAQVYADRHAGGRGTVAALVVLGTAAALLALQWLW